MITARLDHPVVKRGDKWLGITVALPTDPSYGVPVDQNSIIRFTVRQRNSRGPVVFYKTSEVPGEITVTDPSENRFIIHSCVLDVDTYGHHVYDIEVTNPGEPPITPLEGNFPIKDDVTRA